MFSCQKHFSKNKLVQNDKKINNITDTKKSKRASFSASKFFMLKLFRSEEGAMTLEATLIVPIFLIVLIMLASAGEIFMIHQQIAHGVCEAAKRAAVNEYQIRQKRNTGGNLTVLSAKETFLTSVNRRFLDRSALIGGSAAAAAACKLTLTSKGEYIVAVKYHIRKKLPFLSTYSVTFEQKIRQKAMTGYVPKGDELKEGFVYITPHEAVYHKDLSCTHLALDISVDEDVLKYQNGQTHYVMQWFKTNRETSGFKYFKGDEAMSKMRKTGGYMTVEVSALIPIVLMVLWLFFSYLFYFMNCGITQGIMEEALQKAADIRITGADYDTGKISYAKLNQNLIIGNIISSNKNGDTMAQKEIKEKIRQHLFMAKAGSVNVSTTSLKTSVKVKMQSNVITFQFLSGFGIQLFEYEGSLAALGDFEMEQIRGWNTIEGAMD